MYSFEEISFWGDTVIINFISSIPYIGNILVIWIWGVFLINNSNQFFSIHFILPFIILLINIFHLFFLNLTGSSNLTWTNKGLYKIPFHLYFTFKDLLGFNVIILSIFFDIVLSILLYLFFFLLYFNTFIYSESLIILPLPIVQTHISIFNLNGTSFLLFSIPNKL